MPRKLQVEVVVQGNFPSSYRPLLARAARATVAELPAKVWKQLGSSTASLSISIVGPTKIRSLNFQFRGKDRPTDVLSFPAAPMPGSDFVGDILVCWSVAVKQTKAFQTTPKQEVQRLVVHGVLHLFGYDHEVSAAEHRRMFTLQNKVLRGLFTRG